MDRLDLRLDTIEGRSRELQNGSEKICLDSITNLAQNDTKNINMK